MLVLVILAVVWAAVLVPPFVRNRRDGRPDNSVLSFRAQLSTLERATPGTTLRPYASSGRTVAAPRPSAAVKRRRRDVLVGLAGATAFSFLLVLAVGGALLTLLFLASASALGLYVYALRQLQLRALEREAKVRTLHPRTQPAPILAMRRASN
ncbi:MAG: hypothetical protein KF703_19200 [Actinobacteria bacterium]|nr:hypothetical protein [Actinomycetota bacterium]